MQRNFVIVAYVIIGSRWSSNLLHLSQVGHDQYVCSYSKGRAMEYQYSLYFRVLVS